MLARAGLAGLGMAALLGGCGLPPPPPERAPVTRTVWLDQGWSDGQRQWFHHVSQGTATLPVQYEWFLALEQPELSLFGAPGLFSDADYMRRWGFMDAPKSADNPGGLPIGIALTADFKDPNTGHIQRAAGFTCAACHTGQLTYQGTALRIDGGAAVANIPGMLKALGFAAILTKYVPGRFDRFAHRVLGERYSEAAAAELKQAYDSNLETIKHIARLDKSVEKHSVEEGFMRLDALNRIGNQVFALDTGKDANYAATTAPVSFPHIWNTSWFTWVQWDGSIMQPMVRNAGEALGVASGINLTGPKESRFQTTARLDALHRIETQLAGEQAPLPRQRFGGLASPRWPEELLGRIDRTQAAAGRQLYEQHCQGCHLPAPDSPAFWADQHWATLPGSRQRYLAVPLIPQKVVGTDPMQARVLAERNVDTTGIGIDASIQLLGPQGCQPVPAPVQDGPAVNFAAALGAVVQQTMDTWYRQHQVPPEQQSVMNGDRPNCLQNAPVYRARPLNGVWATAPFLHNASVPTLYDLLSPGAERPATVWLGNLEFDPVKVGIDPREFARGTRVDTTRPGNSNRGHEFDDAPAGTPGVIGPKFSPEQRRALVEYLKTL
ncbi:MAG: hypothetical protein RLZZ584_1226 [Pseudomonadota bacterium]